jgi:hypothetical protein
LDENADECGRTVEALEVTGDHVQLVVRTAQPTHPRGSSTSPEGVGAGRRGPRQGPPSRLDHAHKTALALVRDHDVIVHEALRVPNMTRSASGTAEAPGTKVAQKSGLNRPILEARWGCSCRSWPTRLQALAAS